MIFDKKNGPKYAYNFYQQETGELMVSTIPIGKLPKIKMTLPKIKIKENFELKFS